MQLKADLAVATAGVDQIRAAPPQRLEQPQTQRVLSGWAVLAGSAQLDRDGVVVAPAAQVSTPEIRSYPPAASSADVR